MMRFAIGGIYHESNTFARSRTGLNDFNVLLAEDIRLIHQGGQSIISGYLSRSAALGVESVPLMFARATPGGPITTTAFETLADQLVGLLSDRTWDAVLLALHGAAVAEEYLDADAELLRRIRQVVGPTTPVVATLDLHANISEEMVSNSTALVTYRTNPHIDPAPRAEEAAQIAFDAATGRAKPVQFVVTVPAALNILRQDTDNEPMVTVNQHLTEILSRPKVLSASAAEGYPYADVPKMGMSALVVADGDESLASRYANELAATIWALKEDFTGTATAIGDALEHVRSLDEGPVLLLDVGDNIGGGAPGDSVAILREAITLDVPGLFMILTAPEALHECVQAGVGAAVEVSLGPDSNLREAPVRVRGTVISIRDGQFEDQSPTHGGQTYFDAGPTAVLKAANGLTLAITGRAIVPASSRQLTSLGLNPSDFRAIVAKGVNSPRAGYEPLTVETIFLDTPGCTSADLTNLHFENRRHPMYPFDDVSDVSLGQTHGHEQAQ